MSGGRGVGVAGRRKVPALISTFENSLATKAIPTKFCHFYYNLLMNKIMKNVFVKGMTCCHGNLTLDAMLNARDLSKIITL